MAKKKRNKNANEIEAPRTELGRTLMRLRAEYIASGGKLYSLDEINEELGREATSKPRRTRTVR